MKSGVAKRMRKHAQAVSDSTLMETVVCSKCGQRFAFHKDSSVAGAELVEKQAAWVEDQLVWDHIQERPHHGSMEFPNLK